jgi:hypothetical protein
VFKRKSRSKEEPKVFDTGNTFKYGTIKAVGVDKEGSFSTKRH